MFSQEIRIPDAVIRDVNHNVETRKTTLLVSGTMTPLLAQFLLGKTDLIFNENGTPKAGFTRMTLDTGCAAFRAIFEADPTLKQTFEVTSGHSTDKYTVARQKDGVIRLGLRLNCEGETQNAYAYVTAVGTLESNLRVIPLQSEIEGDPDEDDEEENDEETEDQEELFAVQ